MAVYFRKSTWFIELSEILYPPVLINRVSILQSIKNIVSGVIASDGGRKTIRGNRAKVCCERPSPRNVMETEPFMSHQCGWLKRPETVWHQEVCWQGKPISPQSQRTTAN